MLRLFQFQEGFSGREIARIAAVSERVLSPLNRVGTRPPSRHSEPVIREPQRRLLWLHRGVRLYGKA